MRETYAVPQVMQFEDHDQFYWQQDGAQPHRAINVRNFLNDFWGKVDRKVRSCSMASTFTGPDPVWGHFVTICGVT